jgi:hypothetical protein
MSTAERVLLAVAVIAVDLLIFVVPVTGLVAAFILLARPPWFREWVERLYSQPEQQ